MIYSLHESLSHAIEDLMFAVADQNPEMINRVIDEDLATAYVFAKELEVHGYESFCDLAKQYDKGEAS